MTKVLFGKSKTRAEFTIKGHAEAEKVNGYDLCCCAISMMCALTEDYLTKRKLKNLKIKKDDGYFCASFERTGISAVKAIEVLEAVFGGYCMLEEVYPSNICTLRSDYV